MKRNVIERTALALALCLLLAACSGQEASPSESPEEALNDGYVPSADGASPSPFMPSKGGSSPELEETDWPVVSVDLESFGLTASFEDERFMYIFNHTDTVPLDQLIVFDLWGDALTEGSSEELRSRFLEAPDTVLAYLVLMGDQRVDYWDQPLASEVICQSIASADAVWHEGTEEFTQVLASCREHYPSGRVAELLDVMEQEHAASMERNHGPSQ